MIITAERLSSKPNTLQSHFSNVQENKPKKNMFLEQKSILAISVGSPSYEDKKIEKAARLMNNRFSECDILLADSLQRFTRSLRNHKEPEQNREATLAAGDDWLERNHKALQEIRVPCSILRWDQFCDTKEFEKDFDWINQLHREHEAFRNSVSESVAVFKKRNPDVHWDESAVRCCEGYILEETAVVLSLARRAYCRLLYAGPMPAAFDEALKLFKPPLNENHKLAWLNISNYIT